MSRRAEVCELKSHYVFIGSSVRYFPYLDVQNRVPNGALWAQDVGQKRVIFVIHIKHWESSHNLDLQFLLKYWGRNSSCVFNSSPYSAPWDEASSFLTFSGCCLFWENTGFTFPHGHTSACFSHLIYEAAPAFAAPCLDSLEGSPWVSEAMLLALYGPWIGFTDCHYCSALLCVTQGVYLKQGWDSHRPINRGLQTGLLLHHRL